MRLTHGWQAIALLLLLCPRAWAGPPERIVSTHLCTDEYVFRLVPRQRIAALSFLAADTHPVVSTIAGKVKGIPLIRGSAEEVLSLSPDLVVMYEGTNPRLRAHLVEMHIPFIELPWANSLAEIRAVTRKLGAAVGAPARAEALLDQMNRTLAQARARATAPPVPTLVYEPNGYATAGGMTDEILAAAGLSDIASSLGPTRSGTIPVEMVIADAPRLLILNTSSGVPRSEAEHVLRHPALAALDGRTKVATMELTPLLCPGPWSVDVAPALAKLGRDALAETSPRH